MKYLIFNKLTAGIVATGIFLMLSACDEKEEPPIVPSAPILTDSDLPQELLTEIFTEDIPENIKNVDAFFKRIQEKGMVIYKGLDPNRQYLSKYQFVFKNQCIYDEGNPKNIGFRFGSYVDQITFDFEGGLILSNLVFHSIEGEGFPEYPDFFDQGIGNRGYVSGNIEENNYTVFYRVNGTFENINYGAIWIVSFSIEATNSVFLKDVTKCLIMVSKGPDPEGKVASVGAVRIFRDDKPDMDG